MARTIQDILTEARVYIQDTVQPYRTSDATLVTYLNNGIAEIRRLRPDYFVNTYSAPLPQFTDSDLAEDYPIDEQTNSAIAYFVAGSVELQDDENVNEGRAAGLLSLFNTKLTKA